MSDFADWAHEAQPDGRAPAGLDQAGVDRWEAALCSACGRVESSRWTLWVESDTLRQHCDHRAKFRLCDKHYRLLMSLLVQIPNDPTNPGFKGYT